jgi:DNA polymerase I-like protein with 3'-5' exonuclease and polymerase domains
LRLYKQLVDFFKGIGHDWKLDHQLYINSCRLLAQSKSRGVLVDRVRLVEEIAKIEVDLVHSEADFRQKFAAQIEDIEAKNISAWLDELKTERGRDKRREALEADRSGVMDKAKLKFNIKSPSQKELLFVKYLGIQPTFKTPTGSPSFKDSHLKSYGEGGEMLAGRGNLQFVKSQAESLLALTEYDSRWHLDMKATGAKTSRMSGGRAD